MSDKKSDYRRTFKSLEMNISACLAQLDHDPLRQPKTLADLDFDQFWKDIEVISQKLCFEANKIALSWINPPVPTNADMAQMCGCLEMACVALLGAAASFPEEAGEMVNTQLRNVTISILESCVSFSKTLQATAGKKLGSQNHPLLPDFGVVMKNCEATATLPRSNKDACVGALNEEHSILKDAVRELEEARKTVDSDDEDDNDPLDEGENKWEEKDSKIMNPSIGLMKATAALTKKTGSAVAKYGKNDRKEELAEYDSVVKHMGELSPAVDDLAMCLYPPVSWTECRKAAEKLKSVAMKALQFLGVTHFMTSEEAKNWRSFVEKAFEHNYSEIDRVMVEHGLQNLKVENFEVKQVSAE